VFCKKNRRPPSGWAGVNFRVQCCSVQGATRRTSRRDSEANARITSYLHCTFYHNILIRKDHQDFFAIRVVHTRIRQQNPARADERSPVIYQAVSIHGTVGCVGGVRVFARGEVETKRGELEEGHRRNNRSQGWPGVT
jgi:hypothetical protein